jgi:hypothetical protein
MNIKRHTQFLLDKEKDSPDAKLRYRIKWDGSIVAFNVGFRIDISKWSTETQRCKNATTHSKKKISSNIINKEITRFEQAADETFLHFEKQKTVPDESAFRNKFNAIIHPQKKQTNNIENFFDVFDNFVKETGARNEWAERTYLRFNVIKNHLKSFNPNLTTTITDDFLQEFIKYLQL